MTVKRTITLALVMVGLINLYPVIGVLSAERLNSLYGIALEDLNLIILMRHRAVLFGLLGGFMIFAAFKPAWQTLACWAGLASMLAFVAIAYSTGGYGQAVGRVVSADLYASIGLAAALTMRHYLPRQAGAR